MATFDPADLAQVRAAAEAGKRSLGAGPRTAIVAETTLTAAELHPGAPEVRVRMLSPSSEPRGLMIYIHGGGWVMYSIDHYDRLARHLADLTGWAIVMIDYPIAPEHHFPEPLDCAWEAIGWMEGPDGRAWLDTEIAVPSRRVLAGDSAGGNIAAACLLRARDGNGFPGDPRSPRSEVDPSSPRPRQTLRNLPSFDGALLVYPVLDHDLDRPSYFRALFPADIERDEMRVCWDLYCPDPALRESPDASPLRAASLAGLPPTMLITAEGDVLNSEIDIYAAHLAEAGVPLVTEHFAGIGHGCLNLWGYSAEVDRVIGQIAGWLEGVGGR
ncbi:alpha/beta hydrolase [Acidipropionibacterium thoenii]|uniref:alpha/beta hydrolase n=1 Tax=Acidipropionibacterium thoenii TaxID=1751 RepID=UPI00041EEEEB|nr:alpha/beta hydrolase [Acidipropionibacterium thoenii]